MGKMFSKKVLALTLASFVAAGSLLGAVVGGDTNATASEKEHLSQSKIKNVIFLIGDGMGPAYTTAYRYFNDDPSTPEMEKTVFVDDLAGMQKTYSFDKEENVTDSAAAGTAMASGVKTYNGAIGIDMDKQPVETVLERAKENGKSTGLVVTSQVNHATPAVFASHDESRHNYNAIADDYYDDLVNGKHKVDVILGGGTKYFERDDRNLAKEFEDDGYSYVKTRKDLLNNDNQQVLGLFAPVGLPKALDRSDDIPSLKEMTISGIERLNQNNKGFFLMVEGSQIDWAGHDNDIVGVTSEMEDFAKAYKAAIDFAKKDQHTLVIATADHSTGGLSIGQEEDYDWYPEPLKAAKRTPEYLATKMNKPEKVEPVLNRYVDLDLTDKEIQSVKDAVKTGKQDEVFNAIKQIFTDRSHTGWTTGGHTGTDVEVYAYGPGSQRFAGLNENTNIAKQIFDIWKKDKQDSIRAEDIIKFVQHFEEDGAFINSEAAHSLRAHLRTVKHFEKQDSTEKVIKHMKGFKSLLDHQRNDGLIYEEAYAQLKEDADQLIKKWKK